MTKTWQDWERRHAHSLYTGHGDLFDMSNLQIQIYRLSLWQSDTAWPNMCFAALWIFYRHHHHHSLLHHLHHDHHHDLDRDHHCHHHQPQFIILSFVFFSISMTSNDTHTQTRSEPVSIFLKSDLEVSLRNYVHVVLRPASEWIPHAKRLCNLFSSFFHHHKALWPTKSFPGIAFLCSTFLRTAGKYGKIHRYGNKKPETECRHFIKAKKHYDRVFWFTQKLGRKRRWRLTPNFLVDAASNKIHRT